MIDRNTLIEHLDRYVDFPETIIEIVMQHSIFPGKKVWVLTKQRRNSPYEVIYSTVTVERFNESKNRLHFTVEGRYSDGRLYNGSFTVNSLHKTIFLSAIEADKALKRKTRGDI